MKNLILVFFLASCSSIQTMKYIKIFEASLGTETTQIGSNVPVLDAFQQDTYSDSFLIDSPNGTVYNDKFYVPDLYNQRVAIFPLSTKEIQPVPELIIPNSNENYMFSRPYKVYVDYNENIFVLASIQDIESFEVQNYSNSAINIAEYEKYEQAQKEIPNENFYIYKFNAKGKFLLRIGIDNGKPMPFPRKISGDNFDNIYLHFNDISTDTTYISLYRYNSTTGNLNFSMATRNFNIMTNINGTNYQGRITAIDNTKNKEQLIMLTEYQPKNTDSGELVEPFIGNIWSSADMYSILENEFVDTLISSTSLTEDILGVDTYDNVFFQTYNPEEEVLRMRAVSSATQQEILFQAPAHSSYYTLNNYFIDEKGTIYNSIIDRKEKYYLLRWNNKTLNSTQGKK